MIYYTMTSLTCFNTSWHNKEDVVKKRNSIEYSPCKNIRETTMSCKLFVVNQQYVSTTCTMYHKSNSFTFITRSPWNLDGQMCHGQHRTIFAISITFSSKRNSFFAQFQGLQPKIMSCTKSRTLFSTHKQELEIYWN